MDIPKHSHDEFFRAYFSRPELLGSLLRFALPKDLSSALDLSTLAVDGAPTSTNTFANTSQTLPLPYRLPDARRRSMSL